ncbi:hypothetical protein E6W39_35900 [Kitasatospora acidiphila]|uniref:Uncharacterized protein n=1 Tax=Kitasatospora acidiphila TaxID=2567942 RepID=A0A540WCI8_9ACTN|nr:hypothetical protein [Kitasatospora acidiphila]TQF06597.1 hypothetical protein E6W39_35900 [Kitasatospora acidiphila]
MTDHQVLLSEPAARRQPTPADVAALRRLLSGTVFEPEPLGSQDVEFESEEDRTGSAPHCRHAMYYVD